MSQSQRHECGTAEPHNLSGVGRHRCRGEAQSPTSGCWGNSTQCHGHGRCSLASYQLQHLGEQTLQPLLPVAVGRVVPGVLRAWVCPCPSPTGALKRAESLPHLSDTIELTLVAGTWVRYPAERVSKGELVLRLLCPEGARTEGICLLYLYPSPSEAVRRADSRILKAVDLAQSLTGSWPCTCPGQHRKLILVKSYQDAKTEGEVSQPLVYQEVNRVLEWCPTPTQ